MRNRHEQISKLSTSHSCAYRVQVDLKLVVQGMNLLLYNVSLYLLRLVSTFKLKLKLPHASASQAFNTNFQTSRFARS